MLLVIIFSTKENARLNNLVASGVCICQDLVSNIKNMCQNNRILYGFRIFNKMGFSKFNTVKLSYSELECNENSVLMRNWWSNVWTNMKIYCKELHYYKLNLSYSEQKTANSLNSWRILLKNNSFEKTPPYICNIAKNREDGENHCETIASHSTYAVDMDLYVKF